MVFKSKWETLPFVRVALLVSAGIVCARLLPLGAFYTCVFALATGTYLWLQKSVSRPHTTPWLHAAVSFAACVAFFTFGALRMWQTEARTYLSRHTPDSLVQAYEADIISSVNTAANGNQSFTVQVTRLKTANGWHTADAQAQISLQADSVRAVRLVYGSRLLISGVPRPIEPPKNPDAFDYRQLMRNKGIGYQHFVKNNQWQIIPIQPAFSVRGTALQVQQWADYTLEKAMNSPMEAGLAAALIVGLKDDLDDTLLRAYSATGIMHVLAVSGLHVGILFTILSFLLRPLQNHVRGKWFFVGIVLLVLWSYAFVTGLSPSVLRAALMFSLLNIGQLFQRRNSSFNTLALSAVILLALNPLMLFQVGFQLSYIAVAGIMYFYPRFYRLWETRYWLADKIWALICVSTAAQLATFPLGVFYFHQFPNYFLLSNLFAIPLSFLILSGGIAVLATSWNGVLSALLGFLLKWTVWLNNYLAFVVESLPYSAAKSLYFNGIELIFVYVIIFSLAAFFAVRHRFWLATVLIFAAAFSASKIFDRQIQQKTRLLAVLHTPRHASLLWVEKQQGLLLADSLLLAKPQQMRYAFADYLLKKGIDWEQMPVAAIHAAENLPVAARKLPAGVLYRKDGLQIFRLCERVRKPSLPPCNLLLIGNNALRDLQTLPGEQLRQFSHIVLEGTNSLRTVRQLKQQAAAMGIPCHAVALDGAFVLHY